MLGRKSSTGGISIGDTLGEVGVSECASADRWGDPAFMRSEVGSSCIDMGANSSCRPRRRPGNKLSRFGESGRAKLSSTSGSVFGS